jgi:hypothetical protein
MLRIIVCTIGFYVFGVLYAEILNGLNLFNFKVNVYIFACFVALIFLLSEWILKHFEERAKLSKNAEIKFRKIQNTYYLMIAIVACVLLILIPFVWWGAIKTLADKAK